MTPTESLPFGNISGNRVQDEACLQARPGNFRKSRTIDWSFGKLSLTASDTRLITLDLENQVK